MQCAVGLLLAGGVSALTLPVAKKSAPCLVWHSQHKSAGATIEQKLKVFPLKGATVDHEYWKQCKGCKYWCDRLKWDCDKQAFNSVYDPDPSSMVAYGGFTQSLAGTMEWGSPGDGKCVWATMAREPISRLASAYYYCKLQGPHDPLCGSDRLDPTTASFEEFAKHWGNYLFREFLWNPELRALAASRDDFLPDIHCEDKYWEDPWVGLKEQLNGGDDPRSKSGAANLKAVKDRLLGNGAAPMYDAFGVLERWNETLHLFDDQFPLAGTTWMHEGLLASVLHGSDAWKEDELRTIEKARKDPLILELLSADIELYNDVIVPMFDRTMKPLQKSLQPAVDAALNKIRAEQLESRAEHLESLEH